MNKHGQVYKKMLLIYISILLIPILVSVILYEYTYDQVVTQANYYNHNMISTVRSSCDSELKYYFSFLQKIKADDNVKKLADRQGAPDREVYYLEYEIRKMLMTMINSMSEEVIYCPDMFLYVKDRDKIIGSGAMEFDLYSEYYESGVGPFTQEADRVWEILQGLKSSGMFSIRADDGREYILILEPLVGTYGRKGNLVAGIWVDKRALETQVQSVDWNGEMEWGMLDEQMQILRVPAKVADFKPELTDSKALPDKMMIDGNEYHIYTEASEVYGSYVLLTPSEQISQTADKIRNLHLVSLMAILLIGFLMARYAMRQTYDPLKDLLKIFNGKGESEHVVDEFKYLERKISTLLEKHDSAEQSVKSSKKLIRSYMLEKLLLSMPAEEKNNQETKTILDKFRKGKNVVLVFGITENKRPGRKEVVNDDDLKRFVIGNVLSEGIGEIYVHETLEYDEHVVIIVNLPEGVQREPNTLSALTDKYCGFIAEHFNFAVYTLEGGAHRGIEGIHKSYLEACQAEEFCTGLKENYVSYEEIKDRTVRKYQYSFELEEQVINAVRNYNADLAISFIDNVLEMNFRQKEKPNAEMITCLIYDIFTTLVKASEEIGIGFNRMPMISRISSDRSLEEIQSYFHQIVKEVCVKAEGISDGTQRNKLSEKVKAYIAENFTDQGFNISQIAEQFYVTPAYLSTLFKKQTGESILNVIRRMRVDYARELLESGMSVTDAAEKSGFGDLSTFIRTFKNYTGVTPGQIKKVDKI